MRTLKTTLLALGLGLLTSAASWADGSRVSDTDTGPSIGPDARFFASTAPFAPPTAEGQLPVMIMGSNLEAAARTIGAAGGS
ncbi:MAG: hypothetical protein R3E97_05655 [Candidatus Eisenbacteria bacterium]